jgi:hypothetical protein
MTKEKFLAFETIRQSGVTNMFDFLVVIDECAKLGFEFTREDFLDILRNYRKYKWEYIQNRRFDFFPGRS